MNERDLAFFTRCVAEEVVVGSQIETIPLGGECAAAERLYKKGWIQRDPTRTAKPFGYSPTDTGRTVAAWFVDLLEKRQQA